MSEKIFNVTLQGKDNLSSTIKQVKSELNGVGKNASEIDKITAKFEKVVNSTAPLKRRVKEITGMLAEMNAKGIQDNPIFAKMAGEAARLKDAIGDASSAVRLLSSDTATLDAGISALQGLAGVAGVVTGGYQLMGIENENLQKSMVKLQSVIAIMNGLQSVSNVLNKDNILMQKLKQIWTAKNTASEAKHTVAIGANTVAQNIQNSSIKKGTVVQNAWNTAKAIGKAMVGDFSGLLLLGAGAFATYAIATSNATAEEEKAIQSKNAVRDAMIEMKDAVATSVGDTIGKYRALQMQWKMCKNEHMKNEFIEKNKNAWQEFGFELDTVNKTEDFYIKNTTSVCKALELRARQMALFGQMQENYAKYYKQLASFDSVAGGGYYTKSKLKEGDRVTVEEARKAGATGEAVYGIGVTQDLYGSGKGDFILDKNGAAILNAYRDTNENAKQLEKLRANRKRAVDELNKKNAPLIAELEQTSAEIGGIDMSGYGKTGKGKHTKTPTKKKTTTDNKSAYDKYIEELKKQLEKETDEYNLAVVQNKSQEVITALGKKKNQTTQKLLDIEKAQEYGMSLDAFLKRREENQKLLENVLQKGIQSPFGEVFNKINPETSKKVGDEISKRIGLYAGKAIAQQTKESFEDAVADLTSTEWGQALWDIFGDGNQWQGVGEGIALVGENLRQIGQDGAIAKAGAVMASIGQIILGFAQASVQASKLGAFGWLAWTGAGLAAVTTAISTIQSFETGGIIKGTSAHGDKLTMANVNAGEMILNNRQQRNLFKLLDGGGSMSTNTVTPTIKIKGSDLYIALKNYNSKIGKL